jgi:hypothetical protein
MFPFVGWLVPYQGGSPPGIWGGAPPQVGYPLPGQPPGIWGGGMPPHVGGGPMPGQPPGIWGGGMPPHVGGGPMPGQPPGIWGGAPGYPSHPIIPPKPDNKPANPIVLPPEHVSPPLPPDGGSGADWVLVWVPTVGYEWMYIDLGQPKGKPK